MHTCTCTCVNIFVCTYMHVRVHVYVSHRVHGTIHVHLIVGGQYFSLVVFVLHCVLVTPPVMAMLACVQCTCEGVYRNISLTCCL